VETAGDRAGHAVIGVRHSIFEPKALADAVAGHYGLPRPVLCRLWRRRLADVYLIDAAPQRYVLKVYRAGWRPRAQLEVEIRCAFHLKHKGVSVAVPVERGLMEIEAPEGKRYAALLNYVRGDSLYRAPTPENAQRLGRITAEIHAALDDFAEATRPRWDATTLLYDPADALRPFLGRTERDFIENATHTLASRIEGLPIGYCHGDIDPGNVHFDERRQPTVFDFDLCGVGPRAYDLAVFLYECHFARWGPEMGAAFLRGYGLEDRRFIERLAPIRGIWFLALLAQNVNDWGHHELSHYFLDRHLALLHKLMHDS